MEVKETSAKYSVPQFKRAETGNIPMDWLETPIGEMADVTSGGTPSRKVPAFWGGDIPWVTTAELGRGEVMGASQSITTAGLQNSAAKWLPAGTLLIALYGQGKTRGKCGVLRISATTNQACAAIQLIDKVDSEFVRHSLTHRYEYIRGLSNGGSQENLSGAIVKQIRLVMPPTRAEQNAIASALSDADALIDSLEQMLTKKRQIKQGTMQELLTGKRRLPGFSESWSEGTLGQVVAELVAGVSVNSDATEAGTGVPSVVKTSAMKGGVFDPTECKPIIQTDLARATAQLRKNTLLISRMNTPDLVGEVGYVDQDYDWLYLPDRIWMTRMRSSECVCVRWLGFLLSSAQYKRRIGDAATGTSGSMKNIAKGALLGVPVSFPKVDEQKAIAQVLADMDADIAAVESHLTKARAMKLTMAQALLTGRIRLVEPNA